MLYLILETIKKNTQKIVIDGNCHIKINNSYDSEYNLQTNW